MGNQTHWLRPAVFPMVLLFCACAEASAQNLLKNSRFDEDISSWQRLEDSRSAPGLMTWSSLDADGSSKSGSLELRASATYGQETFSAGQCVEVTRPSEYAVFGGRIRVPTGQPVAGTADLRLEHFRSPDCSGRGMSQSGLGGIANAQFWSARVDSAGIRGASSVRLIASINKRYEWQEGDQTGEIDDHVLFHAFFDALSLQLTDEAGVAKFLRSRSTGSSQDKSGSPATASWGKNTVQAPALSIAFLGSDGYPRPGRTAEFSSNEQIRVEAGLKIPYTFEEPQWYPLEDFSVAARNSSQYSVRRPNLEFFLYRTGESSKKPLEIAVDSSGGGVVDIGLSGKSEYRLQTLRTFYACLKSSLAQTKLRELPEPTDDQLLSNPMLEYYVANPPGDYQLVARYLALEAGFWHDPVYSEPLRIRIIRKDLECGKPQVPAEKKPPAY